MDAFRIIRVSTFIGFLTLLGSNESFGQNINSFSFSTDNPVVRSGNYLLHTTDARAFALGNTGIATSADANSVFWNQSKSAFIADSTEMGGVFNYAPVFRALIEDADLFDIALYKGFKNSAFNFNARYFRYGTFPLTDNNGTIISSIRPVSFSLGVGYSRKFTEKLSVGIAANYNYSEERYLIGNVVNGLKFMAFNLSFYRKGAFNTHMGKKTQFSYGLMISDMSSLIKTGFTQKLIAPTNLRAGLSYSLFSTNDLPFSFSMDLTKLLAPSAPVYDATGNGEILSGRDFTTNSSLQNWLYSFSDAPGVVLLDDNGIAEVEKGSIFKEELTELTIGLGLEAQIVNWLALRGGIYMENETKGQGTLVTGGFGLNKKNLSLDLGVALAANDQNANTNSFMLSVGYNID